MSRLPLFATVAASYRQTVARPAGLARLGWTWWAATWLVEIALLLWGGTAPPAWMNLAAGIAASLLQVGFAVAWHCALLTDRWPTTFGAPHFGEREIRYFLLAAPWGVAVGTLDLIMKEVKPWATAHEGEGLPVLVLLGLSLASAALLVPMVRVMLAFPAAALGDRRFGNRESWETTRGLTGRLVAGIFLAMPPFFLAVWLDGLVHAAMAEGESLRAILLKGLSTLAVFLATSVILSFVSLVFHQLRGQRKELLS